MTPYPSTAFTPFMNSLIHAIMYSYYYIAAEPRLKKFIWIKSYITAAQLAQFGIILIQAIALFSQRCMNDMQFAHYVGNTVVGMYYIFMFSHFYYKNYVVKKAK